MGKWTHAQDERGGDGSSSLLCKVVLSTARKEAVLRKGATSRIWASLTVHACCLLCCGSAVDYSELGYIVSSLKFPHYRMACGLLKAVILPLCVWWFRTLPGIVLQLTHLLSQLWETLFCCVDTQVLINAAPLLWENKCYRIIPALRVYSDSVIIANVAHVLGQGLSTSWRFYVPRSYVFSPPPI